MQAIWNGAGFLPCTPLLPQSWSTLNRPGNLNLPDRGCPDQLCDCRRGLAGSTFSACRFCRRPRAGRVQLRAHTLRHCRWINAAAGFPTRNQCLAHHAQVLALGVQCRNHFVHFTRAFVDLCQGSVVRTGRRRIEKDADAFQRKAQTLRDADDVYPFHIDFGIASIAIVAAFRGRQQAAAFIEADGRRRQAGAFCELADFHGIVLCA